jgi:hypothetical protein
MADEVGYVELAIAFSVVLLELSPFGWTDPNAVYVWVGGCKADERGVFERYPWARWWLIDLNNRFFVDDLLVAI